MLIYALFFRILHEICMTEYAESYTLGQQLSLLCSLRSLVLTSEGLKDFSGKHVQKLILRHLNVNYFTYKYTGVSELEVNCVVDVCSQ